MAAATQYEKDLCVVWNLMASYLYRDPRDEEKILDLGLDRILELIPQVPKNMDRIMELTEGKSLGVDFESTEQKYLADIDEFSKQYENAWSELATIIYATCGH